MKPIPPGRRRRLAIAAVGTTAAMVLLPTTAFAASDDGGLLDPVTDVVQAITGGADNGNGGSNDTRSLLPKSTLPGTDLPVVGPAGQKNVNDNEDGKPDVNPDLEVVDQDNAEGYETDDPFFPDHAQGEVGDVNLGAQQGVDLAEATEYGSTVNDDGSTTSEANVFGLFGSELIEARASSAGNNHDESNPLGAICEGTGGFLCLNLFYTQASATNNGASEASSQAGVAAVCVFGNNGDALSSTECKAPIELGVGEGGGLISRDASGHTRAVSQNDLVRLCLGNNIETPQELLNILEQERSIDDCNGLSVKANHSESTSNSNSGATRDSFVLGLDSGTGQPIFRLQNPGKLIPAPLCANTQNDFGLLCIFVNQGEAYILAGDGEGHGSAQEADLIQVLPGLLASVHGGNAETLARQCDAIEDGGFDCPGGEEEQPPPPEEEPACSDGIDNDGDGKVDLEDPGCKGPSDDDEGPGKPACDDGVDNDKDGATDFPADKGCKSPQDQSEAGGGAAGVGGGGEQGGLAFTGFNAGSLAAGAFALIGMGALTMAGTRRRGGKHAL